MIRIIVLSLALLVVTGCTKAPSSSIASNQATKLDIPKTNAPTAKLQRLAPGETPTIRGYGDGVGDAEVNAPRNPDRWLPQLNFSEADQQTYREAYYRGYDSVKPPSSSPTTSPSPTPSPTTSSSITAARIAELQRWGKEDGTGDAAASFAANPGAGILSKGITIPAEQTIYTSAYNNAYQQQPVPSTSPTQIPSRLSTAQLKTQGYDDGYNDAQGKFPSDPNRGIDRWGLTNETDQQIYITAYNNGYQQYVDPSGIVPGRW